jgi:hypothetical protein
LTPESQQKILDATSQLFAEVSQALGTKPIGYEEGVRFIRNLGNKTVVELLVEILSKANPVLFGEGSLKPDSLHEVVRMFAAQENAKAVLSSLPEPDPIHLEILLREVSTMLPAFRRVLLPFAKGLPPPSGGRPKKLGDPETRRLVRKEIGLLLADGVPLATAQARLAQRENVSLTTIQRIWREPKKPRKRPEKSLK